MHRLRSCLHVVAGCMIILATPALSSQATAQSFFSDVFGWLTQSKPTPTPEAAPSDNPFAPSADLDQLQTARSFRRYRTVCVRLCDGYYFPISQATSRRNFYRDAEQCQARCGGETKLFYTAPNAPDIKQARDVSGLVYRRMENAFLYRKKLVKGCTCRPAPWSPGERARHQMYSTAEPEVALTPYADTRSEPRRGDRNSRF
ncbi:MAG: DUF2865 domain-containing protein, partial [Hyphomicrobiaceae bacterium]